MYWKIPLFISSFIFSSPFYATSLLFLKTWGHCLLQDNPDCSATTLIMICEVEIRNYNSVFSNRSVSILLPQLVVKTKYTDTLIKLLLTYLKCLTTFHSCTETCKLDSNVYISLCLIHLKFSFLSLQVTNAT